MKAEEYSLASAGHSAFHPSSFILPLTMRRWKEVEPIITALLKDEIPAGSERTRRYDPDDLRTWWNNAQIRLSTMKPLHKHLVYTAEDNKSGTDEVQVSLPEDFYRPRLVVLPNKQQLPRLSIEEKFYNPAAVGYAIYEGKMILLGAQPATWLMAYDAYYPAIKNNDSRVEIPVWADEACALYVGMQAITREMAADARYRKFIGKQDAGNPAIAVPAGRQVAGGRFNAIVAMHSDDDVDFRK
ncbi:MAG: hypothetical protein HS126_21940 [Anaerolineales bacterium]|nr:hypothetical protein [Anaerolineales bacterium]